MFRVVGFGGFAVLSWCFGTLLAAAKVLGEPVLQPRQGLTPQNPKPQT